MRELMSYLPENYRDSRETVVFQEALQPEVDGIWEARDDLLAQLSPYTATWGLDYWEDALGLLNGLGTDWDTRRLTVAAKLQGRATTTPEIVREVAETLLGTEVEVVELFDEYTVLFTTPAGYLPQPRAVRLRAQLRDILPAHLDFQVIIPMAVLLSSTPRLGPRFSQTTLAGFQGSLPDAVLYMTAWGGCAASTVSPPARASPVMEAAVPVGRALGPRLSRTDPLGRMPPAAFPAASRLGARSSITRLSHGTAKP